MMSYDVNLITFSDDSEMYIGNYEFYKNLYIQCQGCTYMIYAVRNLEMLLEQLILENHKPNIRLLTISDGDLHD